MTIEEAKQEAEQRVYIVYTRGRLEDECLERGFRRDWNIEKVKRTTLEDYLIKKLTKEIYEKINSINRQSN
jgi:hypothetical protein